MDCSKSYRRCRKNSRFLSTITNTRGAAFFNELTSAKSDQLLEGFCPGQAGDPACSPAPSFTSPANCYRFWRIAKFTLEISAETLNVSF